MRPGRPITIWESGCRGGPAGVLAVIAYVTGKVLLKLLEVCEEDLHLLIVVGTFLFFAFLAIVLVFVLGVSHWRSRK